MQILKFIGTHEICPEFRKLIPEIPTEQLHLYRVLGVVRGYYTPKFGVGIYGTLFEGDIKATGVAFLGEYGSSKVFFPEKIASLFIPTLNEYETEGEYYEEEDGKIETEGEIDFAFDVFIEKESSETGYKIIYMPLIPIIGE